MKKYNRPIAMTCDSKLAAISFKTKKIVRFASLEELDRFALIFRRIYGKDSLTML